LSTMWDACIDVKPMLRMRATKLPFPQYFFMACCLIKQWIRLHDRYLLKHRDNFILIFTL
jgi:hypothetical protein